MKFDSIWLMMIVLYSVDGEWLAERRDISFSSNFNRNIKDAIYLSGHFSNSGYRETRTACYLVTEQQHSTTRVSIYDSLLTH